MSPEIKVTVGPRTMSAIHYFRKPFVCAGGKPDSRGIVEKETRLLSLTLPSEMHGISLCSFEIFRVLWNGKDQELIWGIKDVS